MHVAHFVLVVLIVLYLVAADNVSIDLMASNEMLSVVDDWLSIVGCRLPLWPIDKSSSLEHVPYDTVLYGRSDLSRL